jgi:hypothetical protein
LVDRFEHWHVRTGAGSNPSRDETNLVVLELKPKCEQVLETIALGWPTLDILTDANIWSLSDIE